MLFIRLEPVNKSIFLSLLFFPYSFIHSFHDSFIHSSIHSYIHSYVNLLVYSFVRAFALSFVRSIVHSCASWHHQTPNDFDIFRGSFFNRKLWHSFFLVFAFFISSSFSLSFFVFQPRSRNLVVPFQRSSWNVLQKSVKSQFKSLSGSVGVGIYHSPPLSVNHWDVLLFSCPTSLEAVVRSRDKVTTVLSTA